MDRCEDLVRRIVSRSGSLTHATRRDLERELRDHLEDATEELRAEGADEASIRRIVCDRFGDPDEIARELTVAHRVERTALLIVRAMALLVISTLTVGGPIVALQLLVAMCSGTPPREAFPHFREEMIGFGSLALGYTGLYLEERLFHTRRLIKACALNSALFAVLFTLTFLGFHLTVLTPVLAFVSGVAVRALQQTVLRSAWFLGTAVPMAVSYLVAGPLASGHGPLPLWPGVVIRWTGLTAACYSLTLLSRRHHARPGDLAEH